MSFPGNNIHLDEIINNQAIVFKVCHTYCKNASEHEDLAQEIMYQLIKSVPTYNSEVKLTTWMYRVAINVAISFYRSHKTQTIEIEEKHGTSVFQNENDEKEANLKALENFIHELKPFDRALMLLYLESKSYKEIAEIMGLTVTNVSTKINRIKQILKKKFLNDHHATN